MQIINKYINFKTKGRCDIINITDEILAMLDETGLKNGSVTVSANGSTIGITTMEYEPALVKDLQKAFEKIAPENISYFHDQTWGDANGFSHIRASFLGPSLTIPFIDSKLYTGTWQQIVAIDFDNRPRNRNILIQFMGK